MPLGATKGTFCLVCRDKFDDVGGEKMTRNKQVENETEN